MPRPLILRQILSEAPNPAVGGLRASAVHGGVKTIVGPLLIARAQGVPEGTRQRSFGSSASRRPSPRRLKDSTARKMARPGNTAIHTALLRKRCAVLSIEPHDGAGGCWPRPRNDRLASAMIAVATEIVACTISAGRMVGRMCFTAIRTGGLPTARAAST